MTDDRGPIAIVTGAGRGIGRAIAEHLAADGCRLELANLDQGELDEVVTALGPAVIGARAFDLRDRAATDAWLAELGARHARIDQLVLNAGVGGPDPVDDDLALAHLRELCAVDALAPFRIVRGLAPVIRSDGLGRIVVVASVLGKMGVAGFAAYCAAKAAAIGLVRALALDLAPRRITVNAVCPGWTDTAMAEQGFAALAASQGRTPAEARRQVEKGLPLGRIVRPEEVASLVAWLLSEGAGAMTGQALTMSAGDLQK
ncbi:MAG: SDR family oxidoreductase [Planctomycetes bacterium]|nr:SDR family oxidoreductase [Planctomycetota bacterium]